MQNKKHAVLGAFAVAAAAFLLFNSNVQSQQHPSPQMKLGGAWIGTGGSWTGFHSPLDPDGRTAAVRINGIATDFSALLAAFGADTMSECIGQAQMISRDTFKYSFVGYGTKQGPPPVIRFIYVMWGTGTYHGPDALAINATIDVYPAAADANGDGLPDPGTTPVVSIPTTRTAKRVPLP